MLVEYAKYMAEFGAVIAFVPPANPRVYPAGLFPNGTRKECEAEFDKEVEVYQMFLGVSEGLKDLI